MDKYKYINKLNNMSITIIYGLRKIDQIYKKKDNTSIIMYTQEVEEVVAYIEDV